MSRILPVALVALTLGCQGGRAGTGPSTETPEAPFDASIELAASLPAGASRCVVTRPGSVSVRRRPLLAQISDGNALAWLAGASVEAYAWAERAGPGGRRPSVTLLRFAEVDADMRKRLDREIPFRLAWDDKTCPDGDCHALRARFVDHRTLRVERGRWPDRAMPGAEARCLQLARRNPQAAEVASRRGEVVVAGLEDLVPRRIDAVMRVDGGTVRVLRRHRMSSAQSAERELLERLDGLDGLGEHAVAESVARSRKGRDVVTRLRFVWEDLALELRDERRRRQALDQQRRAEDPDPVARVDVSSLAAVRRQIRLRTSRMSSSESSAERKRQARGLRRLLERALAEHRSETELARQLVELLLGELRDGEAASAVATRVLERGPPDAEHWRRVRREAKALVGREALAEVLVSDEVVAEAAADRAAADLVALRGAGVEYEWAESGWVAADALGSRASRLGLGGVKRATLPLDALAETLVTVARLEALLDAPPHAAYLLVRGEAVDGIRHGRGTPSLLEVRDETGEVRLFGAATTGRDSHLRELGERLVDALRPGELEVVVALVPLHARGQRPKPALRVRGVVEDGGFVVERTGPAGRGLAWERVARYVARPLASLEGRLFPPPDLQVEAEQSSDARRLVELAERVAGVECEAEGLRVRCDAPPQEVDLLRLVVEHFAAERLLGDRSGDGGGQP